MVEREWFNATFVAGGEGDETRAGALALVGPESLAIGASYVEWRSSSSRHAIWSALARTRPIEPLHFRLEGALGLADSKTSEAYFLNSTLNSGSAQLSIDAFYRDVVPWHG